MNANSPSPASCYRDEVETGPFLTPPSNQLAYTALS